MAGNGWANGGKSKSFWDDKGKDFWEGSWYAEGEGSWEGSWPPKKV